VWLEHDPADFGVLAASFSRPPPGQSSADGVMRTGLAEAWLTDAEDDSYDLSWFNDLPEADRLAIAKLRGLLKADPDPIDRHFQFAELETRLYRSRDLYESALAEYDEACALHDAEMESICEAFMAKWGKVPLLDTYRQMAIRQQKKKDWEAGKWWAERGLAFYGQRAAREELSRTSSSVAIGPQPNLRPRPLRDARSSWTPPRSRYDCKPGRRYTGYGQPRCRTRGTCLPRMQSPLRAHASPRPQADTLPTMPHGESVTSRSGLEVRTSA
jgi:hypothetical protein